MDTQKLRPSEIVGCIAGVILVLSLLFLPWYDLAENPERDAGNGFICGVDEYSCTGFETFPILRWLLIAAAAAPLILAWIVVRGHKLSWPPGEMTMVVGFTAFVLIFYNGIIDPPGAQIEEIGVTEAIGYYVALFAAIVIAGAGTVRAMDAQKGNLRKTPGTV